MPAGRRLVAASVVGAAIAVTGAWTFTGPLQPAWARRAGTPTRLLSSSRQVGATSTVGKPAAAATTMSGATQLNLPFSARLDGTVRATTPDVNGETIVVIDGRLHNGASGRVHVVLQGRALTNGGVSLERSRAYLGTGGVPALFAGTISALQGTRIVARLADASGRRVELTLDLSLDASGSSMSGRARASRVDRGDE